MIDQIVTNKGENRPNPNETIPITMTWMVLTNLRSTSHTSMTS